MIFFKNLHHKLFSPFLFSFKYLLIWLILFHIPRLCRKKNSFNSLVFFFIFVHPKSLKIDLIEMMRGEESIQHFQKRKKQNRRNFGFSHQNLVCLHHCTETEQQHFISYRNNSSIPNNKILTLSFFALIFFFFWCVMRISLCVHSKRVIQKFSCLFISSF